MWGQGWERAEKKERENMNMPHLCGPTMREGYKKTFIPKESWRSVIERGLMSKIWLWIGAGTNFPKWAFMCSHGFRYFISLVFNWCHNSKSGPYFEKEERMTILRKHTKQPKTLNHNSEETCLSLKHHLSMRHSICQIGLSYPHSL